MNQSAAFGVRIRPIATTIGLIIPIALLGIMLKHSNAQDETSQPAKRSNTQRTIGYVSGDQPVTNNTEHRIVQQQRRTYTYPVVDPVTGTTRLETHTYSHGTPQTTRVWRPIPVQPPHGAEVQKLLADLRRSPQEDQETKLAKLRNLLNEEFDKIHQGQAKEIEHTAQRLEALKKRHDERGKNKDAIVKRRIDALLGQPDGLEWIPGQPSASNREPLRATYPTPARSMSVVEAPLFPPTGIPNLPPTVPQGLAQQRAVTIRSKIARNPPSPGSSPESAVDVKPPTNQNSARHSVFDYPTQQQVNVSTSGNDDVFDVARRVASSQLELGAARIEYEKKRDLAEANAIPPSELRSQRAKLTQAEVRKSQTCRARGTDEARSPIRTTTP